MNWLRDTATWYCSGAAWKLAMLMYGAPFETRRGTVFSYLLAFGGMREFSHGWDDFRFLCAARRRGGRVSVQLAARAKVKTAHLRQKARDIDGETP